MSSMTLKKIKYKLRPNNNFNVVPQMCQNINIQNTTSSNVQTQKESERLAGEIIACGFTIVNGIQVPITATSLIPIVVQTTPASNTTMQLIDATLLAETDSSKADLRFLDFFPPPVPPPQFLQPGFVKYNYTYEPVTRQRPCIPYRNIDS